MFLRFDRRIIGIGSALLIFVSLYTIGLMITKRWEETVHKEIRMDLVMISANAGSRLSSSAHAKLRAADGEVKDLYDAQNARLAQILSMNSNIRYVTLAIFKMGRSCLGWIRL